MRLTFGFLGHLFFGFIFALYQPLRFNARFIFCAGFLLSKTELLSCLHGALAAILGKGKGARKCCGYEKDRLYEFHIYHRKIIGQL